MHADRPRGFHLVLVGLPGAGKSTIGRAVAQRLGRRFLDFDEEIELREGRSVYDVFAADGEEYFRRCERQLTDDVREAEPMVLAPGGGWASYPDNVRRLRPPARLAYLRVSPEEAVRRIGPDVSLRPLLRGRNPVSAMARLYAERDRYYMEADLYIDTEAVDMQQLTEMLCDYVAAVEVV
jgi:shikimate kinase